MVNKNIIKSKAVRLGLLALFIIMISTSLILANSCNISYIYGAENGNYLIKEMRGIIGSVEYKANTVIYTKEGDIIRSSKVKSVGTSITGESVIKTGKGLYKDVVGVVLDAPDLYITDVKDMVLDYINKDKRVLLIYVDGLGYESCKKYISENQIPNIQQIGKLEKMLTVYPPITAAAFASLVTGSAPAYTGIHSRNDNVYINSTIFEELTAAGKTYALIEGDICKINADVKAVLNVDKNNNGSTDDEALDEAIKAIAALPDFVLIHFHSLDDAGHSFGPESQEVLEQAIAIDRYIGELSRKWQDIIVLVSDHGMHSTDEGGSHGSFYSEDMYIPFIVKEN